MGYLARCWCGTLSRQCAALGLQLCKQPQSAEAGNDGLPWVPGRPSTRCVQWAATQCVNAHLSDLPLHSNGMCEALKSQARGYAKSKKKGKASQSSSKGAEPSNDFQIDPYRVYVADPLAFPPFEESFLVNQVLFTTLGRCAKAKMDHAVEHFYHELTGVRIGRASPTLLDSVMVDFHGERTNLSHVATVILKSTRMLSVTVYDKVMAPGVLAAIRDSPLQLQPREESNQILVPVPEVSPETRKAMIKLAHQYAEQSRVTIRQVRHKAMADIKASGRQASEDDRKLTERQVEELTKEFVQRVDAALQAKESELDL